MQTSHAQSIEDTDKKLKTLRMARVNMKKALKLNPNFIPTYVFLGLIYNNLGDYDKSEKMYESSLLIPIQKDIDKLTYNNTLYKYTQFDNDKLLKNLINNEIFLGDPKNFNDPFDCPAYRGKNYKTNLGFTKVLDRISISCFSEIKDSILMWSHYADSHRGICIGYRFTDNYLRENELHFGKVDYRENNIPSEIHKNYKGLLNDTFYIKNSVWGYEKEARILGYNLKQNPIPAPYIEEIVFGLDFQEKDKKVIYNIFSNRSDIKFYQVYQDDNDTINLKIRLVNKY